MTQSTTETTTAPAPRWVTTRQKAPSVADVSRVAVLATMAILVLVPIVWTFLSSFKTSSELAERPPSLLPDSFGLDNYTTALASFNFAIYLRNSVIVVVGATLLTLAINSMAAYALAKYNFRGRDVLFMLTLATIMIPLQVILIPVYQVTAQLGLVNTLWGMIIPAAATPTGVFLLRQYMLTIPDDLIQAARIDGAGEFRTFISVVLPICKPALAVLAIFSVVWRWNDFLWPLIIAQNENVYTLPVAVARFAGQQVVPFNLILAMSVVSMVPVIVVFLFTQRHIVQGIASTGIKG
ncbi:MAG TPA: carbohydrate ABC transporter permease [Pseudonocardiaceae bacterium]|jgi:alpha-1,4-digalacturonate transport system permease protein